MKTSMWQRRSSLTIPEATAYLTRPNRPGLWPVLHRVGGQIFATFGDWNTNGGPVPILQVSLEPLGARVVLETAYTEAIERIFDIDGVLYAPYTDPRAQGRVDIPGQNFFYAYREHDTWANAGAVPFDFTHVFGIVKHRHKVLAYGARGESGIITDTDPISSQVYLYLTKPPGSSYLRIKDARVSPDRDNYPGVLYLRAEIWGDPARRPLRFYRWDGDGEPVEVTAEEAQLPARRPLRSSSERLDGARFRGGPPAGAYAYLLLSPTQALTFDSAGALALWQRKENPWSLPHHPAKARYQTSATPS